MSVPGPDSACVRVAGAAAERGAGAAEGAAGVHHPSFTPHQIAERERVRGAAARACASAPRGGQRAGARARGARHREFVLDHQPGVDGHDEPERGPPPGGAAGGAGRAGGVPHQVGGGGGDVGAAREPDRQA
eukprot:8411399-Pyramimonas_sp.AAC.2